MEMTQQRREKDGKCRPGTEPRTRPGSEGEDKQARADQHRRLQEDDRVHNALSVAVAGPEEACQDSRQQRRHPGGRPRLGPREGVGEASPGGQRPGDVPVFTAKVLVLVDVDIGLERREVAELCRVGDQERQVGVDRAAVHGDNQDQRCGERCLRS
jgi:hypothetical protein